MDATSIGALIIAGATALGVLVTWVGKRGENAITGYSSLTNDLQEERDRLEKKVAEQALSLTEHATQHAMDQAAITRLRGLVIELGGTP